LWRPDSAPAATLTVTGANDMSRRLDWPAGASKLGWPGDLPAGEGAQYRLSWPGTAAPTTIRLHILPQSPQPADLEDAASMLIANQCLAQLDRLIELAPKG